MRYHYNKPFYHRQMYGQTHYCDHPLYNFCTLFTIGKKGIAVIQQRFDPKTKTTSWGEVDPWLANDLYLNENFREYFDLVSDLPDGEIYPTVTLRQIMWALKMKPVKREPWETYFDRTRI